MADTRISVVAGFCAGIAEILIGLLHSMEQECSIMEYEGEGEREGRERVEKLNVNLRDNENLLESSIQASVNSLGCDGQSWGVNTLRVIIISGCLRVLFSQLLYPPFWPLRNVAGQIDVSGHPFDTIKTRIQTQSQDRVGDKILYRGPLHCAVTIIRREGLAGLYKGLAAPLIQNALGVALLFGAMDWLRGFLGASIFAPHRFVLACFLIGTVESILYCPFDHIKARLQVGAAKRGRRGGVSVNTGKNTAEIHVSNAMQVMREVMAVKGPLGLYYGWIFQWLKETTGNVALFGVYDIVMLLLGEPGAGRGGSRHAHPEGLHWMHIWPAGSLAGMAYFAVGYPFDTVKSRLQTDSLTSPRFKGPLHAALRILQDEGSIRELYRGLSVCLIRAIPGSAAQFVVFEVVYSLLSAMATIHQTIGPHMANMDHFGLDHF